MAADCALQPTVMPHALFLTALDGWSAPRKAAWDAMNSGGRAEVEQYYFQYLPPNEKPGVAGEWSARELTPNLAHCDSTCDSTLRVRAS